MERLQKVIARAGIASRRAAEEIILSGRVRVNGRVVTELGAKADPMKDKIEVDGRRLVAEAPVYIVLHKPKNVVSTLRDPEGRPTVAEHLRAAPARVYPVGRLDFATSGVLLATNDGDFANGLLHPRGGVPKTYVVKVNGVMGEDDLDAWRDGVKLEDGLTLPAEVRLLRHEGDKTWFEVSLREGRNQQIRRMGEATGFPVMRLARTSFAGVTHEGLRPGEWRYLTMDELLDLRKRFGVPKRVRSAAPERAERPRASGPRGFGGAARAARAESPSGDRNHTAGRPKRGDARARGEPERRRSGAGAPSEPDRKRSERRPERARDDGPPPARSARTGRSGTTPRGAEPRGSRARGREGR